MVNDSAILRLSTNFTLAFWFKPANLTQTNTYILERAAAGGADPNNGYAVLWEYANNQVEFYAGDYTGSNPRTGSGLTLSDTNWHHIIYTYDGSTWEGYLDGANVFSTARTFTLDGGAGALTIGAAAGGSTPAAFCNCQIEDLRIFGRKLTTQEASVLGSGFRIPLGNEVGWWSGKDAQGVTTFNEATLVVNTNYLPDRSGNVNTGNPTGNPTGASSDCPSIIHWIIDTAFRGPRSHKQIITGTQTFAGIVTKNISILRSGALTFVGTTARKTLKPLLGALTFVGSLTKKIGKVLSGAITFIGDLIKRRITPVDIYITAAPSVGVVVDGAPADDVTVDIDPTYGVVLS